MLFSVIIVNYKVAPWLEQCLLSLRLAARQQACEVIVVDNASNDESVALPALFPEVRFIWLDENKGFGEACNAGAREARGEWLLFLNPDTLVVPALLRGMAGFIATHPQTGAVGVRMVDGRGRFLPESKRGMPYPFAVFFRMSGLSRLFPRNRLINHYYQGQLDPHKTWPVDVLAGACMAVRRTVFEKLGGFDEAFFMYGEDIDLS
ncbi:MAG: glycosyltransferase family 2 protein, partial [Flavihumibacter sp.]